MRELTYEYRRPKQERSQRKFNQILDYGEAFLDKHGHGEFALNDVAKDLDIAVGSVYHFFSSKDALLLALADRILDGFADMSARIDNESAETWQDIWRDASAMARDQYRASKPAMTLIFGPACGWEIRLADATGNIRIAEALARSLRRAFDFSFCENLDDLTLRGIVISDAFFRQSYLEHGTITDEYWQMSLDAAFAYLSGFIPKHLPKLSNT